MYANYEQIADAVRAHPQTKVIAVAAAEDEAVINAALHAQRERIAEPIFVGNGPKIKEILRTLDKNPADYNIEAVTDGTAGQAAVELIKDGSAHILVKGMLETKDILSPVVNKANDLRLGKIMTHVVFFQLPGYHKLIVHTDGGMVIYPTLEDKRYIIENAVNTLLSMGYTLPKVAVLAGIEKVNPKMIETLDAAELKRMNQEGIIKNCAVEGPISYDVAMDAEIAHHKGYECPYCGDFDVLIMPNLVAGNILGKCYIVTAKALMTGIIVGAKAPIVMTSRGSTAAEKYYSIALAALTASGAGGKLYGA